MEQIESMSRRDALKTMGVIVATAALSTTRMSAFAAPEKKIKVRNACCFISLLRATVFMWPANWLVRQVSCLVFKEVNHQK